MSAAFELLCFNHDWQVSFCTPGATLPNLQRQLAEKVSALAQGQRMLAVDIDGVPQVAVVLRNDSHSLVVFHPDESDRALFDFIATVDIAFDILHHFITNPYEGITVVDRDAVLRYISPVHERFFGYKPGGAVGQPVHHVIENTRLQEVVRTGKAEIGQVQEMSNTSRVVNRIPITYDGEVVGAIGRVLFRTPEEVHELSRQISSLRAEVNYYETELTRLRHRTFGLDEIVGESEAILKLKSEIRKIAPLDVPVFIAGESGTGKELVAHAIHNLSRRSDKPMVVLNCGALPSTLVESELFGYDSGAFTGAKREGRAGKFEIAHRSSLFLDEVGDLPQEAQVKLLRVLEGSAFERVGSNRQRTTDFRLISATNRDLKRMIADDDYRADLYFRINGVTLTIPPLRQRREDVPILARHFITKIAARVGSTVRSITPEALTLLQGLHWPGNVRQLYHEIQRAIIFANHHELSMEDFSELYQESRTSQENAAGLGVGSGQASMKDTIGSVELNLIRDAIKRFNGNKKRVAEELGISRSYLYKRLAELDL
ncbi:sigma 54-interacting transcriptional regulator [Pseudomonas veronii]|jgi:transcriptional regulator with PAS, ATPase and Fis domain|uniref:Sigma 54-interacting transcriptional regulator n=1 Tax=Pseudomonas veronii TaxID=76761 RepID=A0A7Y1AD87_PSEVE|nr:sigma 54-interacting transcriptional regulator [Pseudomonas veronii]NMY13638.1 sigma 54-interacting transcriptional regulator [Pseudomonas veronii]